MEQTKTKRTRESNFVNITNPQVKEEIKAMLELPDTPECHLNYVMWYKKDNPNNWGLTVKGFPDKNWGTQHVLKLTWVSNEEQVIKYLQPAQHCVNLTKPIEGENFEKLLNIYKKYKK
jgi:hypothetical protein